MHGGVCGWLLRFSFTRTKRCESNSIATIRLEKYLTALLPLHVLLQGDITDADEVNQRTKEWDTYPNASKRAHPFMYCLVLPAFKRAREGGMSSSARTKTTRKTKSQIHRSIHSI
jgi:hypothetical protein